MSIDRLSESAQTLYAELLDLERVAAAESALAAAGSASFVSKSIRGHRYWYLQRSEGATKSQLYLGRDSDALQAWIEEVKDEREQSAADRRSRREICRMLAAAGATTEPAAVVKVVQLLAEAGVFRFGGVLVGTVAFRVLSNLLGVRFRGVATRTEDVDVAQDPRIAVALDGGSAGADLPRRLGELEPPFLPVPGLDPREPSTTFKVRGRQLRVDFLTPAPQGEGGTPVELPHLGCAAHPLPGLRPLIHDSLEAVLLGGDGVLVNVPRPEVFALHKLYASQTRSAAFQTKAAKDLRQAEAVLEVLLTDRPEDLADAWAEMGSVPHAHRSIQAALPHLAAACRDGLLATIPELAARAAAETPS